MNNGGQNKQLVDNYIGDALNSGILDLPLDFCAVHRGAYTISCLTEELQQNVFGEEGLCRWVLYGIVSALLL